MGATVDLTQTDKEFREVGALYRGGDLTFNVERLVTELVQGESAPFLPALRYTDSGFINRQVWERVWEQQRAADRGEDVTVEIPPKYKKEDFRTNDLWRLRGELDVPKERWISYPHLSWADGGEPSPVVTWAGYNHLDQAMALFAYYNHRKDRDTGPKEWMLPLTAGVLQLLPWLLQWHNEPDAGGHRMGKEFKDVVVPELEHELKTFGRTREDAVAWKPSAPPPKPKATRKKKSS